MNTLRLVACCLAATVCHSSGAAGRPDDHGAVFEGGPAAAAGLMLLYLAVIDARVDGVRLEGRGVTPDVVVPFELPYANGADPQLEAALDVLAGRAAESGSEQP